MLAIPSFHQYLFVRKKKSFYKQYTSNENIYSVEMQINVIDLNCKW